MRFQISSMLHMTFLKDRSLPPYLRFAFRRISYWDWGERCRSTQIGGLIRAVQSPVCPKPFVVMCHTPARQTASWSGQQQTQLAEPRLRSLSFPQLCRTAAHTYIGLTDHKQNKTSLHHTRTLHVNLTHIWLLQKFHSAEVCARKTSDSKQDSKH